MIKKEYTKVLCIKECYNYPNNTSIIYLKKGNYYYIDSYSYNDKLSTKVEICIMSNNYYYSIDIYNKENFLSLDELRNQKINQILND